MGEVMQHGVQGQTGTRNQEAEERQEKVAWVTPREQGRRAYGRRIPLMATPYQRGTREYAAWRAGWRDASNEDEDLHAAPPKKITQKEKTAQLQLRFQQLKSTRTSRNQ